MDLFDFLSKPTPGLELGPLGPKQSPLTTTFFSFFVASFDSPSSNSALG